MTIRKDVLKAEGEFGEKFPDAEVIPKTTSFIPWLRDKQVLTVPNTIKEEGVLRIERVTTLKRREEYSCLEQTISLLPEGVRYVTIKLNTGNKGSRRPGFVELAIGNGYNIAELELDNGGRMTSVETENEPLEISSGRCFSFGNMKVQVPKISELAGLIMDGQGAVSVSFER